VRIHLHRDDCPQALAILAGVLGERPSPEGYEVTETGAWVEWEALEHSWLSTTETAAVIVARGVAMAERRGGWSSRLTVVITDALGAIQ